jgi:hypothetical protein
VDRTAQRTASFFTQNAIANCIANSAATAPASLTRRSEGLSRVSWKLSRTVLRGAVGGNADCLLDRKPDKVPFRFTLRDEPLYALAGLWDAWKNPVCDWLQSFSIITVKASAAMSTIHERMPAILLPPEYDEWLDRGETERPPTHLLRPYPETTLQIHPANPKVGNVHNQGIDLLDLP